MRPALEPRAKLTAGDEVGGREGVRLVYEARREADGVVDLAGLDLVHLSGLVID